jgi:iron complex transport system substrate-binding protein
MIRRLLPLALLVAALTSTGCGERGEPVGELPQTYPVTVRGAADRPTALDSRPQRIVALDSGSAELLAAFGLEQRLVGVPAALRSGGAEPIVSRTGQVDVEGVVGLEPDLIVATAGIDQLDVALAARESGAALYVQPDSSVDAVLRGTLELGFLAGEPVRAREVAGRIRKQVQRVEAQVAKEPTVSVFVDTGFFITIPQGSLLGDLIRHAGGKSVAGRSPGADPFPVARLRRLDPDVYLATSDSRVTLTALQADRRTANLTAVRSGRFAVLPSDLILRPGPRVGHALARVARVLHPDAVR